MDKRRKKHISFALDRVILERVDKWIARQEFPPTKTAVLETALREFLERRGEKRDED